MDDEYEEFRQDAFDPERQMTESEALAKRGQLPFKSALMSDDAALIRKVRERLAAPQRVKVSMNDL
ncbi:type II toxin-antitoxin system RelB/DinJ family antitoxin [Pseudomonas brassicacearum]|uniref:type II toxin-antitoxin system RelB/DinJ family antitoxin n=1 Tax=Pseudomonas brassicacearum TaxID=930166 RepID=UPI001D673651|nr:type II toxin-antitoxin system RelB/DinJ family antitoxin [Pseudomonas brassicacearum]CAH0183853.1 hypothetical protein SRABI06_01510 [Pseudomonas brassicacearum]